MFNVRERQVDAHRRQAIPLLQQPIEGEHRGNGPQHAKEDAQPNDDHLRLSDAERRAIRAGHVPRSNASRQALAKLTPTQYGTSPVPVPVPGPVPGLVPAPGPVPTGTGTGHGTGGTGTVRITARAARRPRPS